MARLFDDAAEDRLQAPIGQVAVTAYPLTMAGWFYSDDEGAGRRVILQVASSSVTHNFNLRANVSSDNNVVIVSVAGTEGTNALTTGAGGHEWKLNTWTHACGVFTSSTLRDGYIHGVLRGSNTNDTTPTAIDRTNIGVAQGQFGDGDHFSGRLAEVGLWDVALNQLEISALAQGVPPNLIRRGHLKGYWPLVRPGVALDESGSGVHMIDVQGTQPATHPKLISLPMRTGVVAIPPYKPVAGPLDTWRQGGPL